MAVHIIFRYLSVNVGRISHCLLIRGSLFLDTPCCALLARPRCTAASHITQRNGSVSTQRTHTDTQIHGDPSPSASRTACFPRAFPCNCTLG